MYKDPSFIQLPNDVSELFSDLNSPYPVTVHHTIPCEEFQFTGDNSSAFVFVYGRNHYGSKVPVGQAVLKRIMPDRSIQRTEISEGMYFVSSGPFSLCGAEALIIVRHQYKAQEVIGGPVEQDGRLKYIDGCRDSILIHPVKMGDACLNALYFPPGIDQTAHTHPTHRIGMVLSGSGTCVTPWGECPLVAGMLFVILQEGTEVMHDLQDGSGGIRALAGTHKFKTGDESMVVIAFHPDSDFGATDQFHPMINRTIVDGMSASYIDSIRTK